MSAPAKELRSPPATNTGAWIKVGRWRTRHPFTRSGRIGYAFAFTPEGVAMLLVIFLVGFAAWHSGTNLLYLIFSALISFYLLNGFILWNNLRGVTATRTMPLTVQAGNPFEIVVKLSNRKRLFPSHGLLITNAGDQYSEDLPLFFDHLRSGDTVIQRGQGQFHVRGMRVLTSLTIASRYPFGFEQRTSTLPLNDELLVVPPTYDVRALTSDLPSGFGDQESLDKGAGTDLYGIREYVAGEHARHVHWKSSAKAQKLMIAEHHRDERRQILLVLDNSIAVGNNDTTLADTFETAVVMAASLARHFIEEGYEVGISTASGTVRHGNGRAHLETILRALAVVYLTSEVREPVSWDPKIPSIEITYGNSYRPVRKRSAVSSIMDAAAWAIVAGRFQRSQRASP